MTKKGNRGDRGRGSTNQLPEFVGSRELNTGASHNKSLLVDSSMLQLELDVSQPWFCTAEISQDVLLVDGIFVIL